MSRSLSQMPGPDYEVTISIRAPIAFVHRWCTDYSSDDSKIEGEEYVRRIVSRSRRRVVFEDLSEHPGGWYWARYTVDLSPPLRWHAESVGNASHMVADYELTRVSEKETRFHLRYRRKPSVLPFHRVGVRKRGADDTRAWRRFARALEADYRRSARGSS